MAIEIAHLSTEVDTNLSEVTKLVSDIKHLDDTRVELVKLGEVDLHILKYSSDALNNFWICAQGDVIKIQSQLTDIKGEFVTSLPQTPSPLINLE